MGNCLFEKCFKSYADIPKTKLLRISGLSGECPLKPVLDAFHPIIGDDESVPDIGTAIHADDDVCQEGAWGVIAQAKWYIIQTREEPTVYIKGETDRFKVHPSLGYYFEDNKSKKDGIGKSKLYQLLQWKDDGMKFGWESYLRQLSLYAYCEYVYSKRQVKRGRIRFIDQNDPLREMAEPLDLWAWDVTQKYILQHPALNALRNNDGQVAVTAAKSCNFVPNKFPCSFCAHINECPVHGKDLPSQCDPIMSKKVNKLLPPDKPANIVPDFARMSDAENFAYMDSLRLGEESKCFICKEPAVKGKQVCAKHDKDIEEASKAI